MSAAQAVTPHWATAAQGSVELMTSWATRCDANHQYRYLSKKWSWPTSVMQESFLLRWITNKILKNSQDDDDDDNNNNNHLTAFVLGQPG